MPFDVYVVLATALPDDRSVGPVFDHAAEVHPRMLDTSVNDCSLAVADGSAGSHHLMPVHSTYTPSGVLPVWRENVHSPRYTAMLNEPLPELESDARIDLMLASNVVASDAWMFSFDVIGASMPLYVDMPAV